MQVVQADDSDKLDGLPAGSRYFSIELFDEQQHQLITGATALVPEAIEEISKINDGELPLDEALRYAVGQLSLRRLYGSTRVPHVRIKRVIEVSEADVRKKIADVQAANAARVLS